MIPARFAFACEIARAGGELALGAYRQRDAMVVRNKGLQDIVTATDAAVEDLLVERIRAAFPGDGVLGEEGGYTANYDGHAPLWVLDPIDGTANFARGLPLWCVSVGLIVDARCVAGAIFNPVTGEPHAGSVDTPASCNGQPIHVSPVTEPRKARAGLGFSYRRPPALHAQAVGRLLEAGCEYSRLGSATLGMAYVADGRFEAFFEPHINAWDVAAGIAIVKAAGGWTNDFLADDGLNRGNGILACAPGMQAFFQRELWPLAEAVT